jgi:hypothetical protein
MYSFKILEHYATALSPVRTVKLGSDRLKDYSGASDRFGMNLDFDTLKY